MSDGIVVVGGGGHAKVCIESLLAAGARVDYCVGAPGSSGTCAGVPVLPGDEHLERLAREGYRRAFPAIGDNARRVRLAGDVRTLGYELVNAVHPRATVSSSARLGAGVAVMAGAVVNAEASIGDLAIINTGATVDHDCVIGLAAHVAPNSALAGNVTIGEGTFMGIGCRAVPERTIGSWSIVGAGAVVVHDLGDHITAVGVPARPLDRRSAPQT